MYHRKQRFLLGLLLVGLCCNGMPLKNANAAQTACCIKTTGSYRHPVTKKIADPGNNEGLGQGMVDNIVASKSLYEKDAKGREYVTVRLGMMDQITKVRFFTQKRGASSWKKTSAALMQENVDNNYKNDYRFLISNKTDIVKVQFYVTAMGRDVIFFVSFGNTVSGTSDFVVSVKAASSNAKSNTKNTTKSQNSTGSNKTSKSNTTASKKTTSTSSSTTAKDTESASNSTATSKNKASSSSSTTTFQSTESTSQNANDSSNDTVDSKNTASGDTTDSQSTESSQDSDNTGTEDAKDGADLIAEAQGLVTSKEISTNTATPKEASTKEDGNDNENVATKEDTAGQSNSTASFALSWTFFWQCILIIIIPALVIGAVLCAFLYWMQRKK